MDKFIIDDIKFTGVHFRPTWHVKGEATKHATLADCYIEVEALPKSLQEQIRGFVKRAYRKHLEETRVR